MALMDPSIWTGKYFTGNWVAADSSHDSIEPATGEVLGTVGFATPEIVAEAAARAAEAQREWAAKKPSERAAVMRRAGELFQEHAEEIMGLLIRESGGIAPKVGLEVAVSASECFEASALPTFPHGEVLPSDEDHWSFARRTPVGVVTVISPFNFPMLLSMRSVAPALGLGNAVLLKPDPRTTITGGFVPARIFEEAGLPAGVLQVLPGGLDVGEAVVAAREVNVISFTGSTPAGRKVGEAAARHLKRAHLELGGNNAQIVLPGADIALAASAGAFGSFLHQGQICMTTGRHLVHESQYEEYVAVLAEKARHLPVGNPATEQVALGPIIDERQITNVHRIVTESVERGATVAAGGEYDGLFYRPTVVTDLTVDSPAWAEEIFGPVAPVMKYSTLGEAVDIVNASEFGLSVSILGDAGEAMKIADRIHSGKIHINEQTVADESNAPFGGVGASGTGSRFGGHAANIEAFTNTQWLTVRSDIAPYPF